MFLCLKRCGCLNSGPCDLVLMLVDNDEIVAKRSKSPIYLLSYLHNNINDDNDKKCKQRRSSSVARERTENKHSRFIFSIILCLPVQGFCPCHALEGGWKICTETCLTTRSPTTNHYPDVLPSDRSLYLFPFQYRLQMFSDCSLRLSRVGTPCSREVAVDQP